MTFPTQAVWCDACRKHVRLETGSECGLGPADHSFDDYVAVTATLPCSRAVVEAGRVRRQSCEQSDKSFAASES
jgi:hypothetical protein